MLTFLFSNEVVMRAIVAWVLGVGCAGVVGCGSSSHPDDSTIHSDAGSDGAAIDGVSGDSEPGEGALLDGAYVDSAADSAPLDDALGDSAGLESAPSDSAPGDGEVPDGAPTPSAGCGVMGSSTGTTQDKMLAVTGQPTVRTYRLSVPTTYSPTTPLPLVIGFHGVGGTGAGTQSSFNLESANTGGGKAIFVYPQALTKVEPDGTTAVDWDTTTTGVDFAFFDAVVAATEASYCVDTQRVFATGISAGGIFTNFMGCWRGNVLRAIAPVASEKPWATPQRSGHLCNGEVASMVIHGTNDPYSDYTTNGLGTLDFWLQEDSCQTTGGITDPTTPNACVDYPGCDPGSPVVMCSHDEGHAWPVATGFSCSSTSTVCFDANIAVWTFFSTLSRTSTM